MQYLYHPNAGASHLILTGDEHRYIFKVRRHRVGDTIRLRNLEEQILYGYIIDSIDKKQASLLLSSQRELRLEAKQALHIGWCLIDPKNIEKILPTLNEIGVAKITFIDCQRSQKNFKLDFVRLDKILLNSSQQCGRSVMMQLDRCKSIEEFLRENPNAFMLNFSTQTISADTNIETIIVGCEGGFTSEEHHLVAKERVVAFNSSLILRSESAVCAISSKLLL